MSGPTLPTGKLPSSLMASLLEAVPLADEAVILGPAVGEDAAAIEVPDGTLVVATDPITLTGSDAGRYAVIVNANDVAVSGAVPRWFSVCVLLPPGTAAEDVGELFRDLTATLDRLGATLVGGHTEITPVVREPVLVGQMLGMVAEPGLVRTGGARPGDVLLQVGAAPVEGAAVLAAEAGDRLGGLAPAMLAAAAGAVDDPGISVVAPALRAAGLGATAMHDPTEGGLAGGLHELAQASGVGLRIQRSAVRWFEPGLAVCRELDCDPWATLASGCLLATFPAATADHAATVLARDGLAVARLGPVQPGSGVWVEGTPLPAPDRDEVARVLEH
jgi:hydrogenase expression/formation protein HypE